jgi:EAL domain-containing protein (putative c-di-GMP-specific phosphodiesterase class I)
MNNEQRRQKGGRKTCQKAVDFGTGYPGLSYFRRYLFDKIKIDRSFISELSSRPDCAAIIRAILGMASALNITTANCKRSWSS